MKREITGAHLPGHRSSDSESAQLHSVPVLNTDWFVFPYLAEKNPQEVQSSDQTPTKQSCFTLPEHAAAHTVWRAQGFGVVVDRLFASQREQIIKNDCVCFGVDVKMAVDVRVCTAFSLLYRGFFPTTNNNLKGCNIHNMQHILYCMHLKSIIASSVYLHRCTLLICLL